MRQPSAIHDISLQARAPFDRDSYSPNYRMNYRVNHTPMPMLGVTSDLEDELIAAAKASGGQPWVQDILDRHSNPFFRLWYRLTRKFRTSPVSEPPAEFDLSAFRPIAVGAEEP